MKTNVSVFALIVVGNKKAEKVIKKNWYQKILPQTSNSIYGEKKVWDE